MTLKEQCERMGHRMMLDDEREPPRMECSRCGYVSMTPVLVIREEDEVTFVDTMEEFHAPEPDGPLN